MLKNYPYVGSHYFSQNFKPQDLTIKKEALTKTEARLSHNEVEFIFIEAGEAEIEINGAFFPIEKGNLIHLLPYHVHRIILKKQQQLKIYRIHFSLGLLLLSSMNEKSYLSSIRHLDYIVPIITLNSRKEKQLAFFCEEVLYEKTQTANSFETLHIALISFISYLFQTTKIKPFTKRSPPNGWRCLEYLQLHHQDPITVDLVAKELRLSTEEVKTSLKELTGFTFLQLLNQVRIRNATALLQFPELAVQQIASICGYQSNANFYKQFKDVHHITPTQYRESLKEEQQMIAYDDAWDIAIYILENCRTPLTLTSVADHTSFSVDKINQLLKEKFDFTFKELLNIYRVQIGRLLLLNFDLDLTEVAIKIGFSDVNTFIRNYKKVFHMTPHQEKMTECME